MSSRIARTASIGFPLGSSSSQSPARARNNPTLAKSAGSMRYSRLRGESDSLYEMRWIPIALIGVHGLIHLMGFAKGFGYADLPQLTQPISRSWGVVWLAAACLVTVSAAMIGAGARNYWIVGTFALLVSQAVIFTAWRDAWAGTAANVLLLLIVVHGWLTEGPQSFHAQYLRDADAGLARVAAASLVTEA